MVLDRSPAGLVLRSRNRNSEKGFDEKSEERSDSDVDLLPRHALYVAQELVGRIGWWMALEASIEEVVPNSEGHSP